MISDREENVEIPIDYRVIRRNDQWKIYDVVIDGISLVSNYRSQFNRIIQRGSYAELVKKMRVKQEVEAAEESTASRRKQ
jgi:phospholipid transport system substrate-binding protein